ncbi:MAG TPA: proline/glycine betaine ABC transporter permease [Facklamia tabacinasalis]|jgi:glycine betaine/proline transport system permease protein/glycine betaine/proline transport system substrate-binding protein|uniref:Proline/glycine betaine ABC transporter permease n=1 Tax=Ruoffia tabacinasalis TaxID=87458 RepID=A0ABS0LH79_9LACT|nr:proline/glycine betaine ABC transporter permease [Ruoffia tabacinasalis]MBG9977382.1 proline/glycine betaine ABC transporter permease [Ruoffia tabacinasalis]HJG47952.1 proline/glycine betaine ABC transporter permease [Ruoffia tabacinasalis]
MSSLLDMFPQLPFSEWISNFIDWITANFNVLFDSLNSVGTSSMEWMTRMLMLIPPLAFIIIVMLVAYFVSNRKMGLSIFAGIGLLYIHNQNLWGNMMNTLTLIIVASLISIIVGIPLGILMAKSSLAEKIIQPILDFMQTMPAFVYLIPAVSFFGIGMVPGVFASVIFALPPIVRFTNLGIRQVPEELVEAADSFGSTGWQKLYKVELPNAKSTIMAGTNQTVLLALSMVVTASMIGAPGLGTNVLTALQRGQAGAGFVSGFALVVLAIVIDRILQSSNKSRVD